MPEDTTSREGKEMFVVFMVIAIFSGIGYGVGAARTHEKFKDLADTDVGRVITRRVAQFDVVEVTVKNQEEVLLEVNAEEGRMTFVVYLGHPYFGKFLLLKPGDAISSQWAWCLPNAQKINDRVYKYHQLCPWPMPDQPAEKTEGR